ncbi:MAG: gliding motility lipoprotein GldD [Prolixibacteraceae bacterium]|jgi:gliding motility-associated lipoprotein GldD|nr:gliding motility lipoprotein GldD [Prolixibacteraceae bacterium]
MRYIVTLIIIVCFASCQNKSIPKPKGYFRIALPQKHYKEIQNKFPFSFDIPNYAILANKQAKDEDEFFKIEFKKNDANIYLSYFEVNKNLPKLIEEAHKWAFKHSIRADAIEQKEYINPEHKTYGLIYTIEGNAASPVQFYLTDSTKHFLRGALYFDNVPNQDSLQPVINFITKDIINLIETTHWND